MRNQCASRFTYTTLGRIHKGVYILPETLIHVHWKDTWKLETCPSNDEWKEGEGVGTEIGM